MNDLTIKGIKEGLLASLGEGDWSQLSNNLVDQIKERAAFFEGAKLAVEVGEHILHAAELSELRDRLADNNVMLWAVLGKSQVTENAAKLLGMATQINIGNAKRQENPTDNLPYGDPSVLVERTLRSGVVINYQGHVTVIGDINPGAEIIASGNIVVWGKIRGLVHAGAEGDERSVICALDMNASQLRIAGAAMTSSDKRGKIQPVIARIKGGKIVVDIWNSKNVRGT